MNFMMLKTSFSAKLTVLFAVFALGIVASFGVPAYYSGQRALIDATVAQLLSVATEKEAAFETWIEERSRDVAHLHGSPGLVEYARALIAAGADRESSIAAFQAYTAELASYTGPEGPFDTVRLLDPANGMVVFSTNPNELGTFKENRPYFLNGRRQPFVQNPFYSLSHAAPVMVVAAPVRDERRDLVGVLASELRLSELNAIIARGSGERATEDAYLINSAHLFVTSPRHVPDLAILKRGNFTSPVKNCLSGNNSHGVASDYRGQAVIAVFRWLAKRELCLAVTIDKDEALGPVLEFRRAVLVGAIVVLLLAAFVAWFVARLVTRPVKDLAAATAAVAAGGLASKLPERSSDEIGRLARSFNAMTAALADKDAQIRNYSHDLEARVQQRTAELRATQADLVKQERLATLGRLTTTVSHELRNPLGVISTSLHVVSRKLENHKNARKSVVRALERMDRSVHRCDLIIDELLSFAQSGTLELKIVELDAWLAGVLDELACPDGIVVARNFTLGGERVSIDPERFRRVIVNVFENGCQAISGSRKAGEGRMSVSTTREPGRLAIEFADNGPGIAENIQEQIFEPLFSTKNFGVGLGLTIVRQITVQHGGGVAVKSEEDQGARVTIWLPPYTEPV